jgi:hypothetical protein
VEKRLDATIAQQSCPGDDELRLRRSTDYKTDEIVLVDAHNGDRSSDEVVEEAGEKARAGPKTSQWICDGGCPWLSSV